MPRFFGPDWRDRPVNAQEVKEGTKEPAFHSNGAEPEYGPHDTTTLGRLDPIRHTACKED